MFFTICMLEIYDRQRVVGLMSWLKTGHWFYDMLGKEMQSFLPKPKGLLLHIYHSYQISGK